jgi:hypothetical protein
MNKIRIDENTLKSIINESINKILKEDFDYDYGSQNIMMIRKIYQLALKISEIAESFSTNPIGIYADEILNHCITLKKNLINGEK